MEDGLWGENRNGESFLPDGRITAVVVLSDGRIHCPPCVHAVLQHLKMKNCPLAPRYIGLDEQGRESLAYLPGDCPAGVGDFSDAPCARAMEILCVLHQKLADFSGCLEEETVCHYGPPPCNFVFQDGLPCALIGWDAAGIGGPMGHLAYAVWMRGRTSATRISRRHAQASVYGICWMPTAFPR